MKIQKSIWNFKFKKFVKISKTNHPLLPNQTEYKKVSRLSIHIFYSLNHHHVSYFRGFSIPLHSLKNDVSAFLRFFSSISPSSGCLIWCCMKVKRPTIIGDHIPVKLFVIWLKITLLNWWMKWRDSWGMVTWENFKLVRKFQTLRLKF